MDGQLWKVGELARRTGVTVRALHHYDEIGLLAPSHRTGAGHRLYTTGDVQRLLAIRTLQSLGLLLGEIGEWLDRDATGSAMLDRLRSQLDRLDTQIADLQALRDRLARITGALADGATPDVHDLLHATEEIQMIEKHYTPDQLEELRLRRESLGPDAIRRAEQDWQVLIADVRAAVDAGLDPASDAARDLARRWQALIDAFTGGNPGIEKSLGQMWSSEPSLGDRHGIDAGMMQFIHKAGGGQASDTHEQDPRP